MLDDELPNLDIKGLLTTFEYKLEEFQKQLNQLSFKNDESQRSTALGLQNVYIEFQGLVSGTLLSSTKDKMEKMESQLRDIKRELLNDMTFVRKCYKVLPALSKIKELDDESFERLQKVLALIS